MRFWSRKSRQIGQTQEGLAKNWLEQQGLQVIEQNFHCRGGEIDLIATEQTPQGTTLIFIEVKYRNSTTHGHPMEFVTPQKQTRLQRCAQFYLIKHPEYENFAMRFDVIAIVAEQPPQWIQNAF